MRIALLAKRTTFHKGYGGLETQNKKLGAGLVQRGHTVTVFSPDWELELDEANEGGVKYIFVNCVYRMGPIFGFFGNLQQSNWINRSVMEFEKEHKKQKFDIVLAQSSTGIGVARKKNELNVKVISIAHGTIISEYRTFVETASFTKNPILYVKNTGFTVKNFFRRQRDFIHSSDKVVAVSNYVKTALIEETFASEDKIVVINNGIDPQDFYDVAKDVSRGSKLLYVGQVIKSKGIGDLLKMFSTREFQNMEIDIVGGGDYRGVLEKKVSKNENLKNRFNFVGKVPYAEVLDKYFKNPDYGVFVFPTKRYEGFPMVLVEAMFSGLPVVAYSVGGVSDAIDDNETGFLVKPNKLWDFSDKVMRIVQKQSIKEKFTLKSIEKARRLFTLEKMLDNYEKVMNEVLK